MTVDCVQRKLILFTFETSETRSLGHPPVFSKREKAPEALFYQTKRGLNLRKVTESLQRRDCHGNGPWCVSSRCNNISSAQDPV